MARQLNKTTICEALEAFGFKSGCSITKEIIAKKFRELALQHHPDKGGDAKKLSKIVEAKEVLLRDFESIVTTTVDAKGKEIKSVGSVFIDFLNTVDIKNVKNPFTTYQKGKSRRPK